MASRAGLARKVLPLGVLGGCTVGYRGRGHLVRPAACSAERKAEDDKASAFWLSGSSAGTQSTMACKFDLYDGVIVEPASVPKDTSVFRSMLRASIGEWEALNKKGVWLQIGADAVELIPIAVADFGFEFHHAEKQHVMLTKWLPTGTPSTLPMNASHTVGVGAVVTDADDRVLLVREKTGPAARMGIWKLPTGLVDPGEEIHDAALREVREETGVDASFEFMGGFIVSHSGNLAHPNKSNVYFTVKCRANSTDIKLQDSEIAEAKWFTREEWREMPFPEKGSVWDALNKSALDSDAQLDARYLPFGGGRPGHRWFYSPRPKSSL